MIGVLYAVALGLIAYAVARTVWDLHRQSETTTRQYKHHPIVQKGQGK